MLSQEPDSVCNTYDERQIFNGIMDEIRVWDHERLPEEIALHWNKRVATHTPGLALYWSFDFDMPTTPTASVPPGLVGGLHAPASLNALVQYVVDETGHGGSGVLGRLPTYDPTIVYDSGRASTVPSRPHYVISNAPIIGCHYNCSGGPIVIAVVPGGNITIPLLAATTTTTTVTTIETLPSGGLLYDASMNGANNETITISRPHVIVTGLGSNNNNNTTNNNYNDGDATKQVLFVANNDFTNSSFVYSVTDTQGNYANATVYIVLAAVSTPISQSYTTTQNAGVVLLLGGVSPQGNPLDTYVMSLPTGGVLYQAQFACGENSLAYSCIETNTTNLIAISNVPTRLTADRGLAYYVPFVTSSSSSSSSQENRAGDASSSSSSSSSAYDVFQYAHSDFGITSDVANCTLYVTFVNTSPVCASQTVALNASQLASYSLDSINDAGTETATADSSSSSSYLIDDNAADGTYTGVDGTSSSADATPNGIVLTLVATDQDSALNFYSAFRDRPYFVITEWPTMGTLYQVNSDGSRGAEIVDTGLLPEVRSWAKAVLNFSSQWDSCGTDLCYYCCDPCPNTCDQTAWHATQVLGSPDCWPVYGDSDKSWTSHLPNNPDGEFLDLTFEFPVYPTAISIYENLNPQTVDRVTIASNADGTIATAASSSFTSLSWTTLYADTPSSVPDGLAWIFQPQLCPSPVVASAVRIHLDTTLFAGQWKDIDAVELAGTLEYPTGLVSDAMGRVMYVPRSGVHAPNGGVLDTIGFVASDCISRSSASGYYSIGVAASNAQLASLETTATTAAGAANFHLLPFDTWTSVAAPGSASVVQYDTKKICSDLATRAHTTSDQVVLVSAMVASISENLWSDATRFYQCVAASSLSSSSTITTTIAMGDPISKTSLIPATATTSTNSSNNGTSDAAAILYAVSSNCSLVIVTDQLTASQLSIWYSLRSNQSETIYVYRIAITLQMDCTTKSDYFSRPATGDCVPCADITSADVASMSSPLLMAYKQACKVMMNVSTALRLVMLVATSALAFAALVLACVVIRYRYAAIIRAASFEFCILIFAGSFLAYGGVWAMFAPAKPGQDATSCVAQIWLPQLGFAMIFAPLFLKTYRLSRIFTQEKLMAVSLPNCYLFGFLVAIMAVVVTWLALWTTLGQPEPTVSVSADGLSQFTKCRSKEAFWSIAMILMDGFALLYGVLLCYQVRNTPTTFNESRWIAYSLYNTAFCGLIIVSLVYGLADDVAIQSALVSIGLLWCTSATLCVLFLPKLYNIWMGVIDGSQSTRTYIASDNNNNNNVVVVSPNNQVSPYGTKSHMVGGWTANSVSVFAQQ